MTGDCKCCGAPFQGEIANSRFDRWECGTETMANLDGATVLDRSWSCVALEKMNRQIISLKIQALASDISDAHKTANVIAASIRESERVLRRDIGESAWQRIEPKVSILINGDDISQALKEIKILREELDSKFAPARFA